jgi:hypothetical protein
LPFGGERPAFDVESWKLDVERSIALFAPLKISPKTSDILGKSHPGDCRETAGDFKLQISDCKLRDPEVDALSQAQVTRNLARNEGSAQKVSTDEPSISPDDRSIYPDDRSISPDVWSISLDPFVVRAGAQFVGGD